MPIVYKTKYRMAYLWLLETLQRVGNPFVNEAFVIETANSKIQEEIIELSKCWKPALMMVNTI